MAQTEKEVLMSYQIITINREFESCGSEIAQEVAQRLHLPYIDKFLITEAANQSGQRESRVEASDEKLASRFEYSQAEAASFYTASESHLPTTARIAEIQFQLIRDMAEQGPCVIVGRCANYILRERTDVLDIFVHADVEGRVQRTVERLGVSQSKAARLVRKTDKDRKAYYKNYTGQDWSNPSLYHMIINSDRMSQEECVDLICRTYQGK
jgi:cytidylate kinase